MRIAYLIENAMLPRFNWAVTWPRSGGTHVVYESRPSGTYGHDGSETNFWRSWRGLRTDYDNELRADVGYNGVLSHQSHVKVARLRAGNEYGGTAAIRTRLDERGSDHSEGHGGVP